MGQSTNALIAFGVDLGEELPKFLKAFGGEWDFFLQDLSGLPKYGEPGHTFKEQWAFRDQFPISLIRHCSGDYPMHIIAVTGAQQVAFRGSPEEVKPMVVTVEQVIALKEFMAEHDLEGEPKWLLFSDWS